MRTLTVTIAGTLLVTCSQAWSQSGAGADQKTNSQPLYRVTIVSRTTKAVNYGYLSGPTRIGFAGTPLLSDARGEAKIEPGRGATLIDAKFSNVPPPTRFGPQYLTYVVWAISPDGRAQNIGELTLDSSNNGRLKTSTPFQTFAMIVTAEPYYSVTQPSDAVVMENVVSPSTVGKVEEVNATYELLPRNQFTYHQTSPASSAAKKVSKDEYDAIVALYQAQNAIQIAEAQNAEKYAPDQLARARHLYQQAKGYPATLNKEIISTARAAAQVAEDSRTIAARRARDDQAAAEEQRIVQARKTADTEHAAADAERDQARVEAERAAAQQMQTRARGAGAINSNQPAPAPPNAGNQPPVSVDSDQFYRQHPQAAANRSRLLSALRGSYEATDSPRGVMVVIPDSAVGTPGLSSYFARIASAMKPYRDLHVQVDAHSDGPEEVGYTETRAELVRQGLIAAGLSPSIIVTHGYGNERPRTSSATPAGRAQNRRIEIIISGDAIGTVPSWDRTYTIRPPAQR